MTFLELSEKEYIEFLNGVSFKSFLQSVEMAKYKRNNGSKVFFLGIKEQDSIVCATFVFSGGNFLGKTAYFCRDGFIGDFNNKKLVKFFTLNVKRFLKKHGGYIFIMQPYIPSKELDIDGNTVLNGFNNMNIIDNLKELGFRHKKLNGAFKYLFVLNLDGMSEEKLLKNMNSNVRRAITKSNVPGIRIREIGLDELEIFRKLTLASSFKHGFIDNSLSYYQEIYNLFVPKGLAKFVVAEIDFNLYISSKDEELKKELEKLSNLNLSDKIKSECDMKIKRLEKEINEARDLSLKSDNILPISCGLFIFYGEEVIYLYGGNLVEYSKFHTAHLIQWEMIKDALKNGYKYYNFYGIESPNESDGVYKFKRGFNGCVVDPIGIFELPLSFLYYLRKFISVVFKR